MFVALESVLFEVRINCNTIKCFLDYMLFGLSSLLTPTPFSKFFRDVGKVTARLPSVMDVTVPLPFDKIESLF